jgi:hypothetical protein
VLAQTCLAESGQLRALQCAKLATAQCVGRSVATWLG